MTRKKEITKDFKFKKFNIYGGLSGMPVSTDGVLLGAWINAEQNDTILDIGAGTGLLSLMCAQRFLCAQISAIEINQDAFSTALINFQRSNWTNRLHLIHANILDWETTNTFDTIVCNPPYFTSGEQSHSINRALARHTDALPHTQLLKVSAQLLKPHGKASFILPQFEGAEFISLAKDSGWSVSRLCQVSPTQSKPVNRLLIELSLQEHKTKHTKLIINESGQYTEEFVTLTKDFYLKM